MSSGPMAAPAVSFNLAALRLLLRCGGRGCLDGRQCRIERCEHIVGYVESCARRECAADFDHYVGSALLHHLLVDGAELGLDLLRDISLVALDLVLLTPDLLSGLLALRFPCLGACLQRGVRLLPA